MNLVCFETLSSANLWQNFEAKYTAFIHSNNLICLGQFGISHILKTLLNTVSLGVVCGI